MFSPFHYHNFGIKVGMKWLNHLWWKFMPGSIIKVRWPAGKIIIDVSHPQWQWTLGATRQTFESADPNDHYRPEMESKVGKQGWDWDWTLTDNDINKNVLTIKFRRGKERWASYFAFKWS